MAFAWPVEFTPQDVSWGIQKAGVQFRSPMAGSLDSVEFPGAYWIVSVTLPELPIDEGPGLAAFFLRMCGGVERLLVPYWPRMQPSGTLRGSPTLAVPAARGDQQLVVSGSGTLRRGDMIGCSGAMFGVFADCVSSGGTIVVPLVNRVRGPLTIGSPVIWDSPTIQCAVTATRLLSVFRPGSMQGLAIDLEEQ